MTANVELPGFTGNFEDVLRAEHAAIKQRRERLAKPNPHVSESSSARDDGAGVTYNTVGLALSGGGIRSASFCLGAIQALHHDGAIDRIDYLSTVSGGGYAGASLTAAMSATEGKFPFASASDLKDTPAVHHIRDFSNYLLPKGKKDLIIAVGILLRGLVAIAMLVMPVLLFAAWFTIFCHPTAATLGTPNFFGNDPTALLERLTAFLKNYGIKYPPLFRLTAGEFTLTLWMVLADLGFLVIWAIWKSIKVTVDGWSSVQRFAWAKKRGDSAELAGGFARGWKWLFWMTVVAAFLELQPFILRQMFDGVDENQLFKPIERWLNQVTPILAPLAGATAFLARPLAGMLKRAGNTPGFEAWTKVALGKGLIYLVALIVPSVLWAIYLNLAYAGIQPNGDGAASGLRAWLLPCAEYIAGPVAALMGYFVRVQILSPIAWLYLVLSLVFLIVSYLLNPNANSLHRLYRDRLGKAFLFDPNERVDSKGRPSRNRSNDLKPLDNMKLTDVKPDMTPYPLINAALNIEGSRFANKRGRNADFFLFSPRYVGSDATGYASTKLMEAQEPALDLGTAMAISGAAASSNMGSQSVKALAPTLALLNIRLGYWLRNPKRLLDHRKLLKRFTDARNLFLIKEMLGALNEESRIVYLTDGGHIENLGIYALLKRKCQLIVAVDAEADAMMNFGSLVTLQRYARIDLGVRIDLPWQDIRDVTLKVGAAYADGKAPPSGTIAYTGPHCAAGHIEYENGARGILLYFKSSLTGDENDYVLDYKRRNPDFPHETTGDQFFSEEQFEVYRALGFHAVHSFLTKGSFAAGTKSAPASSGAPAAPSAIPISALTAIAAAISRGSSSTATVTRGKATPAAEAEAEAGPTVVPTGTIPSAAKVAPPPGTVDESHIFRMLGLQ